MKKASKPTNVEVITAGRIWTVTFDIHWGAESNKQFSLNVVAKDATSAITKAEAALRHLGINDYGDNVPYDKLKSVAVVSVGRGDWIHSI